MEHSLSDSCSSIICHILGPHVAEAPALYDPEIVTGDGGARSMASRGRRLNSVESIVFITRLMFLSRWKSDGRNT